jgi:hypothetical protein
MKLTVVLVLVASALVFKACDDGATKDERSKNLGTQSDEEEEETGAAPNDTGSDVPDKSSKTVYTLKIDLETYADTDISAIRFYLSEKDTGNKTFLKEVATPAGFDFQNPNVTFSSQELDSIDGYVGAEACVTAKAVRAGLESDESQPYCFTQW